MKHRFLIVSIAVLLIVSVFGCNPNDDGQNVIAPNPSALTLQVVSAYPELNFDQPLYASASDGEESMIYVIERSGIIYVFEDDPDVQTAEIFLDLSDVVTADKQEQGLLGLAFDPDYIDNGYFYVDYTNKEGTVIARYSVDAENPFSANSDSGVILLSFDQPYDNHNGGNLVFGPDGYLYISTGDGGSGGDPDNRAQDLTDLLGKILRIDVNELSDTMAYSIPSDNPFYGNSEGYREEIYAYGLRNPWRFSFDQDGTLWAADVGQSDREEIDLIVSGGNYGWSIQEGTLDYKDSEGVDTSAFIDPIWEYDHTLGHSITGGYVYIGSEFPQLYGTYIYADYVYGYVWALWVDDAGVVQNELILETDLRISSFGLDTQGELLIVDLQGQIYRFAELE